MKHVNQGIHLNRITSFTLAALLLAPTGALHGDETNRIEIDAKHIGAVISPMLFGHNLEHTRRGIWQGISAEMIANRKFAAVDSGLPMRWNTLATIGNSNPVVCAGPAAALLNGTIGRTDSSLSITGLPSVQLRYLGSF